MNLLLPIAALAALIIASALAAAELVIAHMSRARATTLADEGESGADAFVELLAHRQRNVWILVVLRLIAEGGALLLLVESVPSSSSRGPRIVAAVVGLLVIGVVEGVVKTASIIRTESVIRRVTGIASIATRVPGLQMVGELVSRTLRERTTGVDAGDGRPHVSEEELLAFAEVAVEAEVIEQEEQALIESIIEFGDTIVREVMVPRPDMVTVEVGWKVSDVMEVVILNGFSRVPTVGEGIDDVVGLAYAKDLMRAERDGHGDCAVREYLRTARFVPEQQRVSSLLREMQADQFHMAIVVDEYGGVAGLVTLEDLVEELIGEIVDEFDVEDPMAEPLPGGAYRVNARMPLDEVNDLLVADLPEGDWDTIGGLLFGVLGHIPVAGESVEIGSFRLTADRVQGRRIGIVRIDRVAAS